MELSDSGDKCRVVILPLIKPSEKTVVYLLITPLRFSLEQLLHSRDCLESPRVLTLVGQQ